MGKCTVCPQVEAENTELHQALSESEREVRNLRRVRTNLEAELHKNMEDDPGFQDAKDLFEFWVKATNRSSKRVVFGDPRRKLALRWLPHYGLAYLKQSVAGAAGHPFVVNGKRSATGAKHQRYNDFELILRDEKHIEGFHSLAEQKPNVTPIRGSVKLPDFSHPVDRYISCIRRDFGPGGIRSWWDDKRDEMVWWSVCPVEPSNELMVLARKESSRLRLRCPHEGCTQETLWAEFERREAWQVQRALGLAEVDEAA